MAKSIRSKTKKHFRSIKRTKLVAKKSEAMERAVREVLNTMDTDGDAMITRSGAAALSSATKSVEVVCMADGNEVEVPVVKGPLSKSQMKKYAEKVKMEHNGKYRHKMKSIAQQKKNKIKASQRW